MDSISLVDELWKNELEMLTMFNSEDDLSDIFSKYSGLRQLPRFFSALFHSISVTCTASNYSLLFPVKFLKKLKEEIPNLPAGQIKEIWNLSMKNASILLEDLRVGNEVHSIPLQLNFEVIRVFILHVRIDAEHRLLTNELFRNMPIFLKDSLEICAEKLLESQVVFPILGVCYAWGELNLTMNQYTKDVKNPLLLDVSHLYDLNVNHCYFSSQNWISMLTRLMDNKEVKTRYFVTLLLLQKARTLILQADSSSQVAVKDIIEYFADNLKLIKFSETNSVWNGEPTYITTDTYTIALWYCILKHIPCLIDFLKKKHWSYLASRIIEVFVIHSEDNVPINGQNAFTLTKNFLQGPFFSEIRPLQSAYVTELLKLASEMFQGKKRKLHDNSLSNNETVMWLLHSSAKMWINLANTTPKCKDLELPNELWKRIKQVSEIVNDILQSKEKQKINLEILSKVLKLINYLPLEYLLPGNQMRCLLGLITIMNCIPSISRKKNIFLQSIMIELCKIILAILDGARSIWLLSYINISSLLKVTVEVSRILTETSDLQDFVKWTHQLLNSFIGLSMKNVSTLISLREFIKDMASMLHEENNKSLIICASILLSKFNDALCRAHAQQNYESVCQENAKLLTSVIERKEMPGDEINMELYNHLLEFKCLTSDRKIEISLLLQTMIERELLSLQKGNITLHDANVKLFKTVCKNREVLKDCIPDNFAEKLWFATSKLYNKQLDLDLSVWCKEIGTNKSLDETRANLIKYSIERYIKRPKEVLAQHITISNDKTNAREVEILQVSIECANNEEYKNIVHHTLDLTVSVNDIVTIIPLLQQWKVIAGSISDSSHREVARTPIIDLITKLFCMMVQEKCPCDITVSMPILEFCVCVLHKGKGLLVHQSVLICMELCVLTPLRKVVCQPDLFTCMFEGMYKVLNEIMIQHLYCVLCAPSCFLACVSYVLSCQIQASNQNVVMKYNNAMQEKLDICAQKICKLMTLISEHKTEFSKLVATIIATYVHEVEKVTVFPPIKAHLLIGLNKLIKICDSYFLNVLQKTLKHGSKEIFKNILSDHKSYFRYRGHV